jgi:hypothetical protein
MSTRGSRPILADSFIADEALSQYQVVVYGSTEGHVTNPSASGDADIAGVVQDDAAASGDVVEVIQIGKSYVIASKALSIGDQLQIHDSHGNVCKPTAWASGDGYVGHLEEASSTSGDQVVAFINPREMHI